MKYLMIIFLIFSMGFGVLAQEEDELPPFLQSHVNQCVVFPGLLEAMDITLEEFCYGPEFLRDQGGLNVEVIYPEPEVVEPPFEVPQEEPPFIESAGFLFENVFEQIFGGSNPFAGF